MLWFGRLCKQTGFLFGELAPLNQIKVAIKQEFDTIDAIIFEAALTLNEIETKHKQKEYVIWCKTKSVLFDYCLYSADFAVNKSHLDSMGMSWSVC